MIDNLQITEQKIQYILIAFMLASGIPQLIIGKLSDIYGRRPLMLIATTGFTLTSYLCANSHDIFWLTFFRFFQGLSAATSVVVVYAILRDLYSGEASSKMYSYISCILSVSAMLAPLLGSFIMKQYNTWESTFYFLAIFATLALLMVFFFLPETHTKQSIAPQKKEQKIKQKAWLHILSHRAFWTFMMCTTTAMTGLFLYFSIGSLLLMNQLGLSSAMYSMLFGVNACFYMMGNYLSSLLLAKLSIRKLVLLGNIVACIGSVFMLSSGYLFGLQVGLIVSLNAVITLGSGLMTGPATSSALEPFGDCSGTASGLLGAFQYTLPALIGLGVTRFEISTLTPLALPLIILTLFNLYLLTKLNNVNTPQQDDKHGNDQILC